MSELVNWAVDRAAAGALLMVGLGQDHGIPADVSLAGTGLTASDLSEPGREIAPGVELAIVRNVVATLGPAPGLGIDAGRRFHLTSYGIWGFAVLSSATIGHAVELAMAHLDLTFAFTTFSRRATADEELLLFAPTGLPPDLHRFLVERDIAGVQTLQQDLFASPVPLARVAFTFDRPAEAELACYLKAFGTEPEFGAAENLIAIDRERMAAPLPLANEQTAAIAWAQCKEVLDRRIAATGLAGQVRAHLLQSIDAPPDAVEVASRLHMSERTLRQHLAREGTSFRQILEELRQRLAEEFLAEGRLAVSEVARRLGYVEVSSFSRAVKRWTGASPRAQRSR